MQQVGQSWWWTCTLLDHLLGRKNCSSLTIFEDNIFSLWIIPTYEVRTKCKMWSTKDNKDKNKNQRNINNFYLNFRHLFICYGKCVVFPFQNKPLYKQRQTSFYIRRGIWKIVQIVQGNSLLILDEEYKHK